ncbi:MFS transporter [Herbiconiux flava]|uniref:Putative MFS family arabinose efflux permease n=1 Tax=Herbiconiux flava TaxID=881268 RepID=A0A852SJW5_9MICO|nr:MFS transporter [Herbiconiux flava]NYD69850.1 putative MFS family arabinose efflux permease [Herbiconiux flava]GLK16599.1 MFS transporter [Herbiconiux flava]
MNPPAESPAWRGFERGERAYARIVVALFAAGFATFAQIFDAQAVLPALGRELGVPAAGAALTVSATTIGLAISVLPWASVADRIGRIAAMKISLVSATLLSLLVPLMPGFESVLVMRGLVGLALGAVPAIAVAYLAEELHGSWVGVAAGTYVAGNTIGGIAGRLVAGPLSEVVGWRSGLLAVSVLGAVAAATFFVLVPAARGFVRVREVAVPLRTRILFQLRDPVMLALYAVGFLLMGAFSAVYNYLGFHLTGAPFLVPETLVSLLFVAYLSGTVASRVSGGLGQRIGYLRVMLGGIAVMVAGLVLLFSDSLAVVIVGLVVFTVGCFSAHPVASGLSGRWAQLGRGQSTALYQLAWLSGTAFFGWAVGVVYDGAGWSATLLTVLGMCGAAALAAGVGIGLLGRRRPVPPA